MSTSLKNILNEIVSAHFSKRKSKAKLFLHGLNASLTECKYEHCFVDFVYISRRTSMN